MTISESDRTTQADRVYQQIRDAILGGHLPEVESLSHVALARQFGVSRIPVREAGAAHQAIAQGYDRNRPSNWPQ